MAENDDEGLLAAFIDGELDEPARRAVEARLASEADLRERLAVLQNGGRPFALAFNTLLEHAPVERLKASLDDIQALPEAPPPARRTFWLSRSGVAAAIGLLCVGISIGRLGPVLLAPLVGQQSSPANGPPEDWRHAVAEYATLYRADTFDPPQATRDDELMSVAAKIGLALTPERVALADLQFRGAQILNYDGAALAELVYVDKKAGPILFCIIRNASSEGGITSERRQGFVAMSWTRPTFGYMLIGRLSENRMAELADSLRSRF
jgi:anti-sigma factor RsiW